MPLGGIGVDAIILYARAAGVEEVVVAIVSGAATAGEFGLPWARR